MKTAEEKAAEFWSELTQLREKAFIVELAPSREMSIRFLANLLNDFADEKVEEAAKVVDRADSGEELPAEGVAERIRALKRSKP